MDRVSLGHHRARRKVYAVLEKGYSLSPYPISLVPATCQESANVARGVTAIK